VTNRAENSTQGDAAVLEAALAAAQAGAAVIGDATGRRSSITWESKGHADFVSEVDRGAEEAIRAVLHIRFPDAAIIGEELAESGDSESALTFIVDPLDGTTNFLHGYPWYAVSIGAWQRGRGIAGVIINVPTGETVSARRSAGAFRNGERINVSSITEPRRALLGTGFPFRDVHLLEPYLRQFDALARIVAGIRRTGSAALDFVDVACGRFEAFWELGLSPWDVAAGIVILHEAGGTVTNLDGSEATPRKGGYIAASAAMHPWLLETLRSVSPPDILPRP
jgi:myo-inositol-1(or 4)-monophosphatase